MLLRCPTFSALGPPLERDPRYPDWFLAPELSPPLRPDPSVHLPHFSRVTKNEARRAMYYDVPHLVARDHQLLGWHHARPEPSAFSYRYVSEWRFLGKTTGRRGSVAMEVFRSVDPVRRLPMPEEGARWRVRFPPAMHLPLVGGADGISRTTVEDAQRAAFRCLLELLVHVGVLPLDQATSMSLINYPELESARATV